MLKTDLTNSTEIGSLPEVVLSSDFIQDPQEITENTDISKVDDGDNQGIRHVPLITDDDINEWIYGRNIAHKETRQEKEDYQFGWINRNDYESLIGWKLPALFSHVSDKFWNDLVQMINGCDGYQRMKARAEAIDGRLLRLVPSVESHVGVAMESEKIWSACTLIQNIPKIMRIWCPLDTDREDRGERLLYAINGVWLEAEAKLKIMEDWISCAAEGGITTKESLNIFLGRYGFPPMWTKTKETVVQIWNRGIKDDTIEDAVDVIKPSVTTSDQTQLLDDVSLSVKNTKIPDEFIAMINDYTIDFPEFSRTGLSRMMYRRFKDVYEIRIETIKKPTENTNLKTTNGKQQNDGVYKAFISGQRMVLEGDPLPGYDSSLRKLIIDIHKCYGKKEEQSYLRKKC